MKKTILFIVVSLFMVSRLAYAHSPKGIEAKYEPSKGELLVIVNHPVNNPQNHFIEKIEVIKDNTVIDSKEFSSQLNKDSQEITFAVDIKPGEEVLVKAYCSLSGRLTGRVDIVQAQMKRLKDGRYLSSDSMMDIAVTIKDGLISNIEILEHRGGGLEYGNKAKSLIDKIIAKQSTDVDAVTGATRSSNAFKKNVEDALKQAESN